MGMKKMKYRSSLFMLLVSAFGIVGLLTGNLPDETRQRGERLREIKQTSNRIRSLHSRQEKPMPGEWLAEHREPGQTFAQYSRSRPITLTQTRKFLYVQPIGDFSPPQEKLVNISSEFLSIYFNCRVKILDGIGLDRIPQKAQRVHPRWGDRQILSTYVLDEILAPALPEDAAAMIAFTSSDLWPGRNWNYVFGQASLRQRVGVWSFYRHGRLDGSDEEFRTCLKRTLKVATHETGHMFSINHCIHYRCNMQGSNSLPESDRQPIYLCPECHAKVMLATGFAPPERYRKLVKFCRQYRMNEAAVFYEQSLEKLK